MRKITNLHGEEMFWTLHTWHVLHEILTLWCVPPGILGSTGIDMKLNGQGGSGQFTERWGQRDKWIKLHFLVTNICAKEIDTWVCSGCTEHEKIRKVRLQLFTRIYHSMALKAWK